MSLKFVHMSDNKRISLCYFYCIAVCLNQELSGRPQHLAIQVLNSRLHVSADISAETLRVDISIYRTSSLNRYDAQVIVTLTTSALSVEVKGK